ncbi:MAG: hypothetical protein ACI9V1_000383 [Spirosomataceae bacterium]|jgi:hypothetical protein
MISLWLWLKRKVLRPYLFFSVNFTPLLLQRLSPVQNGCKDRKIQQKEGELFEIGKFVEVEFINQ